MTTSEALAFDSFWRYLATAMWLDETTPTPNTRLREDLDLDSLQRLELVLAMDELGVEVVEELIPHLSTLGDLYDHYCTRLAAESHQHRSR